MEHAAIDALATLEYEKLRDEERERMSSRLTVLGMFFTLVGGFGVASVQSSNVAYLLALFSPVLACLALYVRHSEDTLRSLRKYLHTLEQRYSYSGYEDWIRANPRSFKGGHVDALRYMFVLAQALASIVFIVRVAQDHVVWLAVVLAGIVELVFVVLTWSWLSKKPRKLFG
jgi:hypothetical protein